MPTILRRTGTVDLKLDVTHVRSALMNERDGKGRWFELQLFTLDNPPEGGPTHSLEIKYCSSRKGGGLEPWPGELNVHYTNYLGTLAEVAQAALEHDACMVVVPRPDGAQAHRDMQIIRNNYRRMADKVFEGEFQDHV